MERDSETIRRVKDISRRIENIRCFFGIKSAHAQTQMEIKWILIICWGFIEIWNTCVIYPTPKSFHALNSIELSAVISGSFWSFQRIISPSRSSLPHSLGKPNYYYVKFMRARQT